jgi:hypothetical protein
MLNIVSTGGDFDPYVKYNAKAGRWYVKDGEAESEVQNPTFIADFDNIKTGWLLFLEGQAPSKEWDISLTEPVAKPSDRHKRGFSLRLFSQASFGGVVELSSSSMHLCNAINDLYVAYEAAKADNAGKLPVVKYTGSTPSKDKMGTNYKPNFTIEKWVDRPADFDADSDSSQEAPAVQQAAGSEF